MLKQYSMFLLQVLQAAKALLFLFPHSFPFDGCSTCCLIFFVFCFVLFQKWPSSSPLSALSKRLNLRLRGEEWNCGTRVKTLQYFAAGIIINHRNSFQRSYLTYKLGTFCNNISFQGILLTLGGGNKKSNHVFFDGVVCLLFLFVY